MSLDKLKYETRRRLGHPANECDKWAGLERSHDEGCGEWCRSEEREAKKEGFRKYLESSGVLDALTKGLVALYDQNDKPSSAIEHLQAEVERQAACVSGPLSGGCPNMNTVMKRTNRILQEEAAKFIQQKLGGPTVSEYEKLQAAMSDLQIRYDELRVAHQEKCRELEELKKINPEAFSREAIDDESPKDESAESVQA
ncbi:hypothetical protein RHSIM_Rhsim09G0138600 [Rhododendron simsii]|uniref:Uncharacterized protein n=1 Tax=Rhododendron simsii TaxID=118357 RepID=A0A834GDM5_RHOSS|nr:hypothetical protein RHSIM_Rhsim09G0138600 [Rhododendron simsii]